MAIRLAPYARLDPAGKLPWNPLAWFSKGEKERHRIIHELWALLGIANAKSSVHSESSPHDADERLYIALSMLPLGFASRVLAYAKDASQHDRDVLQIALRYLRSADDRGVVISESRVRMLEMYLSALPLFEVLAGGHLETLGKYLVNHAEIERWEAHRSIRARRYPLAYFLYTTLWPKTSLPSDNDLAWIEINALKLAKLPIGQRGAFDRDYCELLLDTPAAAVVSGAL
jgi:hypothetical protein